jgi:hypothetical protein
MGRRRGNRGANGNRANRANRAKRRKRRTRPGRVRARGPRVDITRGVRLPAGRQRFYDPPHRSLSEGRGLPHTPLIKAMLPIMVLLTAAVFGLVLVVAAVAALLG